MLDEIDSLDDEQRTLMLATSMVDQISAPLARSCRPQTRMLGGFCTRTSRGQPLHAFCRRGWYRLHQLVKQALRGRLLTDQPGVSGGERAAVGQEGEGLEALRFAVESRDWDFVGELLALRSATPLAFSATI